MKRNHPVVRPAGLFIACFFLLLIGHVPTAQCGTGTPNPLRHFLLSFPAVSNWKASWQENDIVLKWSQAGQSGQGFEVEYSIDGQQWQKISGLIPVRAGGASQNYSYTASGPFAESNFFRLKLIDGNGDYSYSSLLQINGPNELAAGIVLSPSQVQSSFTVHNRGKRTICGLRLADSSGQAILQLPVNNGQYHLDKLAPGDYLLLVSLADGSSTVKKLTKL